MGHLPCKNPLSLFVFPFLYTPDSMLPFTETLESPLIFPDPCLALALRLHSLPSRFQGFWFLLWLS